MRFSIVGFRLWGWQRRLQAAHPPFCTGQPSIAVQPMPTNKPFCQVSSSVLRELNLEDNLITELPMECADMQLSKLVVKGNPLMLPPMAIAEQGASRIKQWSCDRKTQLKRPLQRMLLFFVGYGGTGKTTLAELLVRGAVHTCNKVQRARPIREWSSGQLSALIKDSKCCDDIDVQAKLSQFMEKKKITGKMLLDKVLDWDEQKVAKSGMLDEIEAALWWSSFGAWMRNYEKKGYASTVGIDVLEFKLDDGTLVQIADLAGQIEYYVSHALFMASRNSVYVLTSKAADASSGKCNPNQIEEALYWLSSLRSGMPRELRYVAADEVPIATVQLAVTHTDCTNEAIEPALLLNHLVQELRTTKDQPPRLDAGQQLCVPRYDNEAKAEEARQVLHQAVQDHVAGRFMWEADAIALEVIHELVADLNTRRRPPFMAVDELIRKIEPQLRAEMGERFERSEDAGVDGDADYNTSSRTLRLLEDLAATVEVLIIKDVAILDAVRWCSKLLAAFINDLPASNKAWFTETDIMLACTRTGIALQVAPTFP